MGTAGVPMVSISQSRYKAMLIDGLKDTVLLARTEQAMHDIVWMVAREEARERWHALLFNEEYAYPVYSNWPPEAQRLILDLRTEQATWLSLYAIAYWVTAGYAPKQAASDYVVGNITLEELVRLSVLHRA